MKRFLIALVLTSAASATGILTSCNEKPKTVEKTATKPAPSATETDSVKEIELDSTAIEETDSTDTVSTATATTAPANTGGMKFGHINSADLVQLMPETKRADASLQAYVKNLEGKLGGMQNDYRKKISEFQSQEKTMIDAIKETKIKAIQDLEMQMQQSQAEGQEKIARKREELYKPILKKAEKAIKDVGKENGYDYIFDTNAGSTVYEKESHDIMPLVKKKLGLKSV